MTTAHHHLDPRSDGPPTLESGDHLSQTEFLRRYTRRPDLKRAELLGGVVYVASPVRLEYHAEPHAWIAGWAFAFVARRPGVRIADNTTLILAPTDIVQPDLCLFAPTTTLRLDDDGLVVSRPDLVVEIAASSASIDLHGKRRLYERIGVAEYIVWRTRDRAVDCFDLQAGRYVRREPDADGVIASRTFPGLRLDVPKMLAGDLAGVLAALG